MGAMGCIWLVHMVDPSHYFSALRSLLEEKKNEMIFNYMCALYIIYRKSPYGALCCIG
jgi:hypothetical protein